MIPRGLFAVLALRVHCGLFFPEEARTPSFTDSAALSPPCRTPRPLSMLHRRRWKVKPRNQQSSLREEGIQMTHMPRERASPLICLIAARVQRKI